MKHRAILKDGYAIEPGFIVAYHYHPTTGELTGSSDEYISPGVTLPAFSTDIAPPEGKSGFAPVFTDGAWAFVEDHRGKESYSIHDRAQVVIDYLGPVIADYVLNAPTTPYDYWTGSEWQTNHEEQHSTEVEAANQARARLIAEATSIISPLKDALDGGYIDESDKPVLIAWQKYRYALTRVDAEKPVWPEKPA